MSLVFSGLRVSVVSRDLPVFSSSVFFVHPESRLEVYPSDSRVGPTPTFRKVPRLRHVPVPSVRGSRDSLLLLPDSSVSLEVRSSPGFRPDHPRPLFTLLPHEGELLVLVLPFGGSGGG